jgi:4-amino-4-deoxy-L-arabinose transferase-like glycosyltransferase
MLAAQRAEPDPPHSSPRARESTVHRRRLDDVMLLILLATAVGLALRVVHLGALPPGLNQDEAVNGYDAYSLAMTGRDHHGHLWPVAGLESYGDWVSPLLTFLTVPFVGAFGLSAASVRATTAIVGALAIPAAYLLGVELFRRRAVGVVAAWYIALSPWAVHRGRFAIPPSIVPTMVVLTMLAVVWAVRRRSGRMAVAAGVAAGLTTAAYPTMKLYVPLLLLSALWVFRRDLPQLGHRAIAYAVGVFLLITGPIYYLSLGVPGGQTRWQQVTVIGKGYSPGFFVHQYFAYFSPRVFLLEGNGHPAQTATPPSHGVELLSLVPFLLAGGIWVVLAALGRRDRADKPFAQFLLLALLLYPVPGALTTRAPHLNRGIHLIPLLALFVGAGAVVLADLLERAARRAAPAWRRRGLVVAALLASATIGAELLGRYRSYVVDYPRRPEVLGYFQYGQEQAIAYALAHEAEYDSVWLAGGNQTYMYLLFYRPWPPSDVQRALRSQRLAGTWNRVEGIGKFHFGAPSPGAMPSPVLRQTLRDPNGRATWEIRDGRAATGERILLITSIAG